jgi:hypothetical protein
MPKATRPGPACSFAAIDVSHYAPVEGHALAAELAHFLDGVRKAGIPE